MSTQPRLLPLRSDIQGALEWAYYLLLQYPHPNNDLAPSRDHWPTAGSLVLGPLLWLAKTYDRPDVLDWLREPPTPEQSKEFYSSLETPAIPDPDLQNVQSRLQPFLAQQTDTARALKAWLPDVLSTSTQTPNTTF